jgi:homospermidine synthase
MNNKTIILTLASIAVIGTGALGIGTVFAETTTTDNPMTSLVQKIATKFNLKEADVQAVFNEERDTRRAEMEKRYEEQLSTYVSEGKITEDQKKLILAKHEEMEKNRPEMGEMKNLTQEERKAKMDEKRQEMETWAAANGIDMQYMMGMGKGMGGPGFHGNR